jgi:hypothetical protein
MYNGTIIEVFIASPSDITDERNIVHSLIEDWNIINSQKTKIILKSIRWEKNVYSSFGSTPQNIINEQSLKNADLLIGIFGIRLGTPTEEYESGTVEEIKKHIDSNKPTMIYFSNKKIDPSTFEKDQFDKLQEFKKWCQEKGITFDYLNIEEFKDIVRTQLGLIINNNVYFKIDNIVENKPLLNSKQKELLSFFKIFGDIQKGKIKIIDFINKIGDYKFSKIVPILKELKILNAMKGRDGWSVVVMNGYNDYSDKDISDIINDIENGEYSS